MASELAIWLARKGVEKIQEEHRLSIEDKDNALTQLNDDLDESERNIAILQQDNLELQREIEILKRRYVPHLGNSDKDNGMTIIKKNTDEYHYFSICGQHIYRKYRKRDKTVSCQQSQVVLDAETSNEIVKCETRRVKLEKWKKTVSFRKCLILSCSQLFESNKFLDLSQCFLCVIRYSEIGKNVVIIYM